MSVKKRRKKTDRETPPNRLSDIELATMTLLGPASSGIYLSPAMRLVATMLLLWDEDWHRMSEGRYGMDAAEIGDRTSLTPEQVKRVMDKLRDVGLVHERADGWELTFDHWKETTLQAWSDKANFRLRPNQTVR